VNRLVGDFPPGSDSDHVEVNIGAGDLASISHPLRASPHWSVAPDVSRIAYLTTHVDGEDGGRLRLTIVAPSGDTLTARDYPFTGERRPPHVADNILDDRRARWEALPRYREGFQLVLTRGRPQPVYPPVHSMIAGRDSTVWLGFRSTSASRTWLVLDHRGEPIGSLELPTNVRIAVAERATVWTIERDEDGVRSVVRFRVNGW
jgi:hypothetical protein